MAGAGSTSSSTSHTLTLAPGTMPVSSAGSLASMAALLQTIQPANRHVFLQPPPSLASASLHFAKEILDSFAGQVGDEQQLALRAASKKRKREGGGAGGGIGRDDVLKIRKLHVDGFETGQVWQQAKRIIASTLSQSKEALQELEDSNELEADAHGADEDADVLGTDSDDASDVESAEEASDGLQLGEEEEEDSDEFESAAEEAELSEVDEDEDPLGAEEGEEGGVDEDDAEGDEPEEYAEDPEGLNDGFFSIDDFNKQSLWFEDQDARADPNTDKVDDQEEVNWHADPMAAPDSKRKSTASKKAGRPAEEPMSEPEDDDEDAGPTFGDMALDAPEGESDDEMDNGEDMGMGLDLTANDVFYKDFFAPPAKKGKKGFNRKARASQPEGPFVPDEGDVERAMADVRRDLFDDLSEQEDSDDALSEASAGNPKSRKSAHERRLAKLAAEIGKLERENVEKRRWALSGEAAATERPLNSLLEEDLDFEHVGKPVPVITEEVSESIEELIKRRIIAREFDEVIRRRPDEDGSADARRGLVELDDTRNKQGLADMYEEEHTKASNPGGHVSKADEKLDAERREVERLWRNVCASLDSLSNFHYKPRPKEEALTVRADVATVAMEDAQPATAQGVGGAASMMAPQEVYAAGQATAEKGEVVLSSGLPVAREEMSREEKLRRRRRNKERIRKSDTGGQPPSTTAGGRQAKDRQDTLGQLKKGGVKVINRKGEVVDVDGNKAKASQAATSGSFKL